MFDLKYIWNSLFKNHNRFENCWLTDNLKAPPINGPISYVLLIAGFNHKPYYFLQICTRGRIHVMKYLHTEAVKEDRKRGIMNESDHRRNFTKSIQQSYVTVSTNI